MSEDKVLIGGRSTYLSVNEWREKIKIHVRRYDDRDGQLRPTRKGIALSPEEFRDLLSHEAFVKKRVKRLQKKLSAKKPAASSSEEDAE